ncbi:ubiquinol:cytochrome c oxidoreductase subunit [Monoraphidium neglectum]|uniref:Complex III subunit 9 n=1 Tax=Monoraphidium neglectum TaxID=145388 RepID=A0A0D2MV21_9CHLO|nr:ubiquinol:cytochrome c oxidoreductase subunit [Monoraphidium neglectum]KIZ04372.1 ubiquinol:cytochrome c oxidoreductase subunit [Monoraphidium neglectum]|eukprot:XP_013903391.1 ubiquinol:cytochrome c oxidoreductase subunit [Monoraphidium neglectum]
MGLKESIYQVFFKRSTIYVPFVLVGAYFSNEALDTVVTSIWESRNKGKLFKDIEIPVAEAE